VDRRTAGDVRAIGSEGVPIDVMTLHMGESVVEGMMLTRMKKPAFTKQEIA